MKILKYPDKGVVVEFVSEGGEKLEALWTILRPIHRPGYSMFGCVKSGCNGWHVNKTSPGETHTSPRRMIMQGWSDMPWTI